MTIETIDITVTARVRVRRFAQQSVGVREQPATLVAERIAARMVEVTHDGVLVVDAFAEAVVECA